MISHAAAAVGRGKGFAMHEVMDQIGAVAGPLVVSALLSATAGDYHVALGALIIPGIAAYQVLQTVLPKEEALSTLHGYVEERAWKLRKAILRLLRLPGLYRLVPGLFAKGTRKLFGPAAGFAAKELEVTKSVWRVDMTKCPYHDACVRYGCPELCPSFCDSDDITYGGLHPRLLWHRTETLGRGGGRCDFCLRLREPPTQERSDPPCW